VHKVLWLIRWPFVLAGALVAFPFALVGSVVTCDPNTRMQWWDDGEHGVRPWLFDWTRV
jgi:hypothetical protein